MNDKMLTIYVGLSVKKYKKVMREKSTSRQHSGKGTVRKKNPTPKTEVGKHLINNQVLVP